MGARGRERYLGGVVNATTSTTTTASRGHNAQEMSPTQKYSTKKTHFQLEHPVCPALSLNYAHITSCLCCLSPSVLPSLRSLSSFPSQLRVYARHSGLQLTTDSALFPFVFSWSYEEIALLCYSFSLFRVHIQAAEHC